MTVGSPDVSGVDTQPAAPRRAVPLWYRISTTLRGEWVVATVAAFALAVLMTWPTMRHPASTVPQDVFDPLLIAWELAWPGYALTHQPLDLWHANAFFPEPDSFAFTDSLLGYAPLSFFGTGPVAAVIRYNLVYVLIAALAFLGAYALARQLGARWPGAAVAGAACAYAPWRLAQTGHLHVLSTGGIALCLAALAKGHGYSFRHGYRRNAVRPGWAAAGWALACWQITIGFGIGLAFAYVLAVTGIGAVVGWLLAGRHGERPKVAPRLVFTDMGGVCLFIVVSALMAAPYLRVAAAHPYAKRSEAELGFYSPPLRGFLTAPAESWIWGGTQAAARARLPFPPEMTMLPGFTVGLFAVIGIVFSVWTVRQRLLLAGAAVLSLLLGMGTTFFGGIYTYLVLYRYLPGWEAIRTPGRWVVWTTLLLGLLAAGAVTAAGDRLAGQSGVEASGDRAVGYGSLKPRRWPGWVAAAMTLPLLLVLIEGVNRTPHPTVPRAPTGFQQASGPVLVLPSDGRDTWVMLWSTDGFVKMVNGVSGFTPKSQAEIRKVAESFPDQTSVDYLRDRGIRTVVVLGGEVEGTPYVNALTAPIDGLPVQRRDVGDDVVFTLEPR